MKYNIEIDISENKIDFVNKILESLSFVKKVKIYNEKEQEIKQIKDAFKQAELIKKGALKTRSVKAFLDEIQH